MKFRYILSIPVLCWCFTIGTFSVILFDSVQKTIIVNEELENLPCDHFPKHFIANRDGIFTVGHTQAYSLEEVLSVTSRCGGEVIFPK